MVPRYRSVLGLVVLIAAGMIASSNLDAQVPIVDDLTAIPGPPVTSKPALRAQWWWSQRVGTDTIRGASMSERALFGRKAEPLWSAEVSSPVWSSLGPTTIVDGQIGLSGRSREVAGRVTVLAVRPGHANRFWLAGTAAGGIWRTADGGGTWQAGTLPRPPDGRFDPVFLSVGALAFSPGGCLAYAGTGDATGLTFRYGGSGLLRSADSGDLGRHWKRLNVKLRYPIDDKGKESDEMPFEWSGVAVSGILTAGEPCGSKPDSSHAIWLATRPTMETFEVPGDPLAIAGQMDQNWFGVFHGEADPRRDELVLRPAGTYGSVWRAAVTDLKADPTAAHCIYAGVAYNRGFALPGAGAVYRSPSCTKGIKNDPLTKWQSLHTSPTGPRYVRTVKIAIADRCVGYASYSFGPDNVKYDPPQLYRTDTLSDGCQTCPPGSCGWTPLDFDPATQQPGAHYCNWNPASPYPIDNAMCLHANVLSVHPSDPNTLLAGGIALWKCHDCRTNGIRLWTDISYLTPQVRPPSSLLDLLPWRRHTWQWGSPRYGIHVDQQALEWAGGERLVVGNDGGVWSSRWSDPGTQPVWDTHNFGLAIAQVHRGVVDPRTTRFVFAGAQDLGTIRREGPRWRWLQGGDGVGILVSHKYPELHWATAHQSVLVRNAAGEGNRFALWRTRDAGLTFQRADLGLDSAGSEWVPPLVQCPNAKRDVLLFGSRSLWRVEGFFTIPSTREYESASPPAWGRNYEPEDEHTVTAVAFASDPDDFEAGDSCQTYAFAYARNKYPEKSGVYYTRVGGGLVKDNWHQLGPLDLTLRRISALAFGSEPPAVGAAKPQTMLYLALSTYRHVKTKPAASRCVGYICKRPLKGPPSTWEDITPKGWTESEFKQSPRPLLPSQLIDQPFHALAVVPESKDGRRPQLIFAGSDFGVWMTYNDGTSWCHLPVDDDTPHPPVMDLKVHSPTNEVYAFTFGRGVFRLGDVKEAWSACAEKLGEGRVVNSGRRQQGLPVAAAQVSPQSASAFRESTPR